MIGATWQQHDATVRAPRTSYQPARGTTVFAAKAIVEVAGRALLSLLFLLSGIVKVSAYAATSAYMPSFGLSSALLPLVIVTEILGAIAVILGWKTRIVALVLAGYSLLAALVFDAHVANPVEAATFLKNISIVGGFFLLLANGAGPLSLDHRSDARAA